MFRGGFIGGHLANSFFFSFFFLPIHYTLSYFVCKILPSLINLFLSFSTEGGKENSTMFIIIFPLAAGGLLLALSGLIILRRMQKKRRDLKLQGISADCFQRYLSIQVSFFSGGNVRFFIILSVRDGTSVIQGYCSVHFLEEQRE